MAKRGGAGRGGIVIAQEIRALVEANKAITGPEVVSALKQKYPAVKFNENSVQVAYANTRKKLGISRTVARRPIGAGRGRGGARGGGRPAAATTSATTAAPVKVDISLLQAAKDLLQHCKGDAGLAVSALKQIAALQMS